MYWPHDCDARVGRVRSLLIEARSIPQEVLAVNRCLCCSVTVGKILKRNIQIDLQRAEWVVAEIHTKGHLAMRNAPYPALHLLRNSSGVPEPCA